jgi:hypothetical protein
VRENLHAPLTCGDDGIAGGTTGGGSDPGTYARPLSVLILAALSHE